MASFISRLVARAGRRNKISKQWIVPLATRPWNQTETHAGGACFARCVGARFEMASRCVGTSLADQAFFFGPLLASLGRADPGVLGVYDTKTQGDGLMTLPIGRVGPFFLFDLYFFLK